MAEDRPARIARFLAGEYRAARTAEQAGDIAAAWRHLERAHVVAQARLIPHCRSHWAMLRLALRLRDWREAAGQAIRLMLAPIGNLTGRLPPGNVGRSRVSAFAPMAIPPDLEAILHPESR